MARHWIWVQVRGFFWVQGSVTSGRGGKQLDLYRNNESELEWLFVLCVSMLSWPAQGVLRLSPDDCLRYPAPHNTHTNLDRTDGIDNGWMNAWMDRSIERWMDWKMRVDQQGWPSGSFLYPHLGDCIQVCSLQQNSHALQQGSSVLRDKKIYSNSRIMTRLIFWARWMYCLYFNSIVAYPTTKKLHLTSKLWDGAIQQQNIVWLRLCEARESPVRAICRWLAYPGEHRVYRWVVVGGCVMNKKKFSIFEWEETYWNTEYMVWLENCAEFKAEE